MDFCVFSNETDLSSKLNVTISTSVPNVSNLCLLAIEISATTNFKCEKLSAFLIVFNFQRFCLGAKRRSIELLTFYNTQNEWQESPIIYRIIVRMHYHALLEIETAFARCVKPVVENTLRRKVCWRWKMTFTIYRTIPPECLNVKVTFWFIVGQPS